MSEPTNRMRDGIPLQAFLDAHVFAGLAVVASGAELPVAPNLAEDGEPIALFASHKPGA